MPNTPTLLSRRSFLLGSAGATALALAGCSTFDASTVAQPQPVISPYYLQMYAALPDERFPIPAVDLTRMNPDYWRAEVDDPTGERPGTIVVDTGNRYLYLVGENRRAMRYGVGVGREGFAWSGRAEIRAKKQWPTWTPPPEMIERQPEVAQYRDGMAPGIDNPLGARALYLYRDGRDLGYRLHGSSDPALIGQAVSSGCVRLINQDVVDLYNRVPVGTPVLVG